MNIKTPVAAACGALALALVLAACGSQGTEPPAAGASSSATGAATAPPSPAGPHNDADFDFAQMMAIHHEGAVVMANLAARVGSLDEVRALGERISAAQGPEIDQMHAWLQAWGAPREADSMDGMDMGGDDQGAAMAELNALTGADFDRRFLELMIEHHRSAITMSEAELAAGESPESLELAQTIIDTQKAEITEMEQLLQAL